MSCTRQPYTYSAHRSGWWRWRYAIEVEGSVIMIVRSKKEAKSIVSALNGAYNMGLFRGKSDYLNRWREEV